MEIAHGLDDHQSTYFVWILGDTYQRYEHRPLLSRLACVEHEGARYLAATNGACALFLPTNQALPLGDYKGVPYLVSTGDAKLASSIDGLLSQLKMAQKLAFYEDDSVMAMSAVLESNVADTRVLLAHVTDDKFIIDLDKPHDVIFNCDAYYNMFDAIGYIHSVYYQQPDKQLCFMNDRGRGFALIMPIHPGTPIKKS